MMKSVVITYGMMMITSALLTTASSAQTTQTAYAQELAQYGKETSDDEALQAYVAQVLNNEELF